VSVLDSLRDGMLPQVTLDREAARTATVVSLVVLLTLGGVQSAVGMAFTSGHQPITGVESVPVDPTANTWSQAEGRTVEMQGQQMAKPWGGGSTDAVTVKAITNETHVAFRVTWEDPTNDSNLASPRNYSDAVAVMLKTGSQPPITMGAAGTPVNIWYWRATWQFGNHAERGSWTGDMYSYPHQNNLTKPGERVGNPLAKDEYRRYAQNYYAKGYGSLSNAPSQPVAARGERTEDGWSVVFVRERTADGQFDATFDTEKKVYLAFAVWNGSADEVNGQKSLTYQYSVIDGGTLSKAASGDAAGSGDSGGSAGSGTSADDETESGGGALVSPSFEQGLTTILAVTFVAWLIAYRSVRRRDR
jgi:hypothetical protein